MKFMEVLADVLEHMADAGNCDRRILLATYLVLAHGIVHAADSLVQNHLRLHSEVVVVHPEFICVDVAKMKCKVQRCCYVDLEVVQCEYVLLKITEHGHAEPVLK